MQAATFASISQQAAGRASAAFNSIRQVAASFGVALLATVLTNRLDHHGAQLGNPLTRDGALSRFHDAFIAATVIAVLGVLAALLIDDKLTAGTMRISVPAESEEQRAPVAVYSGSGSPCHLPS